jgi:hypothetical protein
MRVTVGCTWPGCCRSVKLPAKAFRCKVHQKMEAVMAKQADGGTRMRIEVRNRVDARSER